MVEDLPRSVNFCYSEDAMDEWDFHTKGDGQCEACVESPARCKSCPGLVHIQFMGQEMDVLEAKCDQCGSPVAPFDN